MDSFTIPHIYLVPPIYGSTPYIMVAALMIFYPLSGFIADICCGRFKTIIISQTLIIVSLTFTCVAVIVLRNKNVGNSYRFNNILQEGEGIFVLTLLIFAATFFSVGLIGYQANFIQFGLDQLLEAPSQYLGLFVHYATWVSCISYLLVTVVMDILLYYSATRYTFVKKVLLLTAPFLLATAASLLLLVSCCNHHWFYREAGQHNPYTTVCRVLNFARRHKCPLQRSAFTYGDDNIPSRLDFAKERFGGPFTTEEVENVKTLLRIVLLLLALGPVHMLQVPTSQNVFPLFGYHIGHGSLDASFWTKAARTGFLMVLSSSVLFLMYIWCIFSVFRNRIPSMFKRLGLGIVLSLLGIIALLITDIVGHSQGVADSESQSQRQCMFRVTEYNYTRKFHPLNLHWYVVIPPSVLLGIGPLIVTTTTIEFISAQSPHSMKGLLVGVFYALQGFFQLLGYVTILPFSLTDSWIHKNTPSSISCGFIYFLITCIIGLIGFIIFLVAAKIYKYRKRDDETFNQMKVEEIYIRYLTQNAENNSYTEKDE